MEYFLERIAGKIFEENSDNLRNHCIVLPSRRAGLYFKKYLGSLIRKPVWSPSVMTINEFFAFFSPLHVPENEILLIELYKIYRRIKKSSESFDEFYFWGEMILNDFDDIDKYLVDASLLFKNVIDLKEIDNTFGGLDEDQIEIIRRFWRNFEPHKPTSEKDGFITFWSVLNDVYTHTQEEDLDIAKKQLDSVFSSLLWNKVGTKNIA